MSDPNYITCACQNCNGHIKFGADQLKPGETRRIECPHCHLETLIFNKSSATGIPAAPEPPKTGGKGNIRKSSRVELFLFELTRIPLVAGAIFVLLALIIVAIVAAPALLPERPPEPPAISYEMVVPAEQTQSYVGSTGSALTAQGAHIAKKPFPQPVTDFLLNHQDFSLMQWLDQLGPQDRRSYLNNLAIFLSTANSKNLPTDRLESVVGQFSDMWVATAKDNADALEKRNQAKQAHLAVLGYVAAVLFVTLVTASLILVLLAIERNTRLNARLIELK